MGGLSGPSASKSGIRLMAGLARSRQPADQAAWLASDAKLRLDIKRFAAICRFELHISIEFLEITLSFDVITE
jgi:hypothetical protein